jgi:hypothetical protein
MLQQGMAGTADMAGTAGSEPLLGAGLRLRPDLPAWLTGAWAEMKLSL